MLLNLTLSGFPLFKLIPVVIEISNCRKKRKLKIHFFNHSCHALSYLNALLRYQLFQLQLIYSSGPKLRCFPIRLRIDCIFTELNRSYILRMYLRVKYVVFRTLLALRCVIP